MTRFHSFLMAGGLVLPLAAGAASGQVVNGNFDAGLSGWETLGHAEINTLNVTPTNGATAAHISTASSNGAVNASDLEVFLNMPFGSMDAVVTTTSQTGPTNGSAIRQMINVPAGAETLSFDFNFVTNEFPEDPLWNDTAFWTLIGVHDGQMLADTYSTPFFSGATGFSNMTGYSTISIPAPAPGSYLLGFGVVNVHDSFADSGLLINNVQITMIPEPAGLGLLAIGGLMALRRRR